MSREIESFSEKIGKHLRPLDAKFEIKSKDNVSQARQSPEPLTDPDSGDAYEKVSKEVVFGGAKMEQLVKERSRIKGILDSDDNSHDRDLLDTRLKEVEAQMLELEDKKS